MCLYVVYVCVCFSLFFFVILPQKQFLLLFLQNNSYYPKS